MRRLRVGDGADPATDVGPLVTAAQQHRVLDYLDIGVAEGARIAAQAPLPDDPELADGFYVAPTLLTDVTPDMRVAREEIFGPVVALIRFADEDEAVRIANGTQFGLVAGVFSQDSDRALRVSRQIRAGTVFVNNYFRISIGTGFGGVGHSGFGREHAQETLAEYGYYQDHPAGRQPRRAAALGRAQPECWRDNNRMRTIALEEHYATTAIHATGRALAESRPGIAEPICRSR